MAYRINDDENRIQELTDKIDQLEVQTFSPEVVARNESTRNTGIESGDVAAINPYPQWIPIRDFGTIGNITLDVTQNRVDSHVAKLTANGDIDFAFTVPPGTNKMMQFILDVTVDNVGGYTFNLLNNILPTGITIDNTADARTVIRFTTTDGGVTYYAEDLTTGGGGDVTFPIDFPEEDRGDVGASTQVIDFSATTRHSTIMTLTGDIGISLTNLPANDLAIASIKLIQDATGGHAFIGFSQSVDNEQTIIDAVDNANAAGDSTSFVVEFEDGVLTAYLKTGNIVSGGGGSLSEPIELGFNEATVGATTVVAGDIFNPTHIALTQSTTIQLDISTNPSKYKSIFIIFDTTGSSFIVSWPASVTNPPVINDSVAQRISVILYTIDNGTTWTHATSTGSSTGGEFFGPWTANHDAGEQSLTNLALLQLVDTGGVSRSSISGEASTSGTTRLSLSSGSDFIISDILTDIATFDLTTGLTMATGRVINMGNNIINTIAELQFSNLNSHTVSNELSIAFDTIDDALKYAVALTTDSHRFYANTDLLASFSRVGTNEGLLSIQAVTAAFLQATDTLFLSTFDNTSPTNGDVWRDSGTGEFKFRQNTVTVGLSGAGANTALSNLTITSVNQDLLPNTAGTFNLGSAALRWGNCFFGRIVFPTNTSPIAGDVNIVRNGDDMQCNVGTGNTFNWTFQAGSTQMELSSTELRLPGVNLDMENNSITDANQIQITGTSGDTLRGFLSGASTVFDITANENNSKVRIFARDSGGLLDNMIEADASTGFVILGQGGLGFGDSSNRPTISRSGNDLNSNVVSGAAINLQVAATAVINITSTDINVFQDFNMDNSVTVDWATTQSTVGAAGGASALPATPSSYIIIKVNGAEFVIPAYLQA